VWLHPDRADVLSALALVAKQGDALPQGFARLAAADPVLQPWIERLNPALTQGQALGATLRAKRLVTREQARYLDRLGAERIAPALRAAARGDRGVLRLTWFAAYYPLVVVAVLVGLPLLVAWVSDLGEIYDEMGVRMSAMSGFVLGTPWWQQVPVATALLGGMGLLCWTINRVLGLRAIPSLWAPATMRAASVCRVLQAVERSESEACEEWWLLWLLCVPVTNPELRQMIHEIPDEEIMTRLRRLGLLVEVNGTVDWIASHDLARGRLLAARRREYPWLAALLVAAGLFSFISGLFGPMSDLIRYF
jgi:hypothetical protein